MTDKPFLLIDVDGPLNPWAASGKKNQKAGFRRYRIDGFIVYLKRAHGQALVDLTDVYDLVWCTTWEHQANTDIGPKVGLPDLPVIEFKKFLPGQPPSPGLHWKTAVITAYAMAHDRPFAWVDDEVGAHDGVWFAQWCHHPFLAKKVNPEIGLTDKDFTELREWAEGGMYGD